MTPPDDGPGSQAEALRGGFSAVTRTRFADHAYAVLFHKIVTGELGEGAALPSEHELCALFNISRPVVREALGRLRRENLIESRRGSGSFVRPRPPVHMSSRYVAEKQALLLQNLEFRAAIEPPAAAYAAERRSPRQLQAIIEAVEHFREVAIVQESTGDHLDYSFHHAVALASANHRFVEAIETVEYDIDHGVNLVRFLVRFDHLERSRSVYEDHSRICMAIRDQDPEAARVFMRAHLENARRRMLQRQPLLAISSN